MSNNPTQVLTFLLFLKMADQQGVAPDSFPWGALLKPWWATALQCTTPFYQFIRWHEIIG
jgi:hypothetical protein